MELSTWNFKLSSSLPWCFLYFVQVQNRGRGTEADAGCWSTEDERFQGFEQRTDKLLFEADGPPGTGVNGRNPKDDGWEKFLKSGRRPSREPWFKKYWLLIFVMFDIFWYTSLKYENQILHREPFLALACIFMYQSNLRLYFRKQYSQNE